MIEDLIEILESRVHSMSLQKERLIKPVKIGNREFLPYIDEYRESLILRLGNEITKHQRLLANLRLLKVRFNSKFVHFLNYHANIMA